MQKLNDVVYDHPPNASFSSKIESVQYNEITGAIKGSSSDKLYQKSGLECHNKEDGWGDCVCSIKFFQLDKHHIY